MAVAEGLNRLRSLGVSFERKGSAGDLEQLGRLTQLEELWLMETVPTDRGFESLARLKKLRDLVIDPVLIRPNEMWIDRGTSMKLSNRFKAVLPRCRVRVLSG